MNYLTCNIDSLKLVHHVISVCTSMAKHGYVASIEFKHSAHTCHAQHIVMI